MTRGDVLERLAGLDHVVIRARRSRDQQQDEDSRHE